MIFKTASPISPDVDVIIDNVPTSYLSLQRISMEERENTHSIVVLDFTGIAPEFLTEYVDKPIQLSISFSNSNTTTFNGYIVYLEPTSVTKDGLVNGSPFQITRMYCLNASYVMRSKVSRSWDNVSLVDIATTLADKYRLSVSVPNDKYRFPRLVQAGMSDWSFLVMACNRLGYSVLVRGTHIHIWDPYKAIARRTSYSTLKTIKGNNGAVTPSGGQILRFDSRIGAVSTSGSRTPDTLHTLDKNGNIITVGGASFEETSGLGTPLQSIFTDTLVANTDDYDTAHRLITGALRRKFSMTATVDITGTPSLTPGGIVKIDKYESKFDGYWYVRSVRHELTRSELYSIVDIAKDATDGDDYEINTTTAYTEPPEPSLLAGKWVAKKDMQDVYA